MVKSCS